jgi:hypothetical protein
MTEVYASAYHCSNRGIHPGCIATAGQDCESRFVHGLNMMERFRSDLTRVGQDWASVGLGWRRVVKGER